MISLLPLPFCRIVKQQVVETNLMFCRPIVNTVVRHAEKAGKPHENNEQRTTDAMMRCYPTSPLTTTTPLNRRFARHHHLLSLSHRIRTSQIMNYLAKSTSIYSRALSCMASNIHMTMRKPTQAPAFSFLLFQTCNMGTKAMLKTNKAAAKRIRIRGSGSVKR